MKRTTYMMVAGAVVIFVAYMTWAQPDRGRGMGGMMRQDRDRHEPCCMHGPMMAGMTQKALASTSDGGVFVLCGNKLMKFDAELKLGKQIEVPMDEQAMCQKMEQMMSKCPMCNAPQDTMGRGPHQNNTDDGMTMQPNDSD